MKLVEKMAVKFDKLSDEEKQENLNMARYLLSLMYHGLEKAIFDGNGIMMSSRDKDGEVKFFMISAYEVRNIHMHNENLDFDSEEHLISEDYHSEERIKDLKELHEDNFEEKEEK